MKIDHSAPQNLTIAIDGEVIWQGEYTGHSMLTNSGQTHYHTVRNQHIICNQCGRKWASLINNSRKAIHDCATHTCYDCRGDNATNINGGRIITDSLLKRKQFFRLDPWPYELLLREFLLCTETEFDINVLAR